MYLLGMLLGLFLLMSALAVDLGQHVSFFAEGMRFYCLDQRYGFCEDELIAYSLACFSEGRLLLGAQDYDFSISSLKGSIRGDRRERDRFFITIFLYEGEHIVRQRELVIFLRPDGAITYAFVA